MFWKATGHVLESFELSIVPNRMLETYRSCESVAKHKSRPVCLRAGKEPHLLRSDDFEIDTLVNRTQSTEPILFDFAFAFAARPPASKRTLSKALYAPRSCISKWEIYPERERGICSVRARALDQRALHNNRSSFTSAADAATICARKAFSRRASSAQHDRSDLAILVGV